MTHRWMAIHRRRRRRPFVVICLALSLLVPLGASPAAADTSEGRLAFMRGFSVWVADADGADRRDLGFQGGLTWTRLSPDGATITFWGRPDGIPRLRQLDVSSGDVTNLLANPVGSPVYVYTAPSSPDGSQVAVTMQRGLTNTETYRRSLDDVNVVGAAGVVSTFNACGTMAAGKIVALDWSGDGRIWTVCQPLDSDGDQLPGARWRVFRMNADGTGQSSFHVLPADHYLNDPHFAVSRDGTRMLISSYNRLLGTTTMRTVIRTTAGAVTRVDAAYGAVTWSPDGTRLAGSDAAGMWTIDADGTGKAPVPGTVAGDRLTHWSRVETCGAGFEPSNGGELIIGTPGDDLLEGTPGNDVICGLGGVDDIYGFDGDDWIDGGPGNDRLYAGDGDDVLLGGGGRDYLVGNDGFDTIDGGPGDDDLLGGKGPDSLFGRAGNDQLRGGPGDDILSGGDGDDDLFGDAGDDELSGGDGTDLLVGDDPDGTLAGNDILRGGADGDVLAGGKGDDELYGEGGDDSLRGDAGADLLLGGDGDDVLRGGADRDRLSGGRGSDSLYGGPANDHLTGGPRKDRLEGEGGNDTLIARDGVRDVVRGGPGTNDKARVDAGVDDVTGVEALLP